MRAPFCSLRTALLGAEKQLGKHKQRHADVARLDVDKVPEAGEVLASICACVSAAGPNNRL
jgi:hypothetical protein